jgi:hypothetical protein
MPIPGNRLTTAMAVMPHRDVDRALELSLSLDVPYWPQLPKVSYFEDMYVQASEHFPGMGLDLDILSLDVYSNGEVFSSYARASGIFLIGEESFLGGLCPLISSPLSKRPWTPWEKRPPGFGRSCTKRGLTLNFFSPGACCRRPPAVWSIRMRKRPWKKPSK